MPRFARNPRAQATAPVSLDKQHVRPGNAYSNFKLAALFLVCVCVAYGQQLYKNPLLLKELKKGNLAALWPARRDAASVTADPLRRPGDEYAAEIHRHFGEENFGVLEKLVAALRASKQRLPGGEWKLTAFYRGLRPTAAEQQPPARWQANLNKLGKWAAQFPASATPQIALVDNFAQFAEPLQTRAELDKLPPGRRRQLNEGLALGEQTLTLASFATAGQANDPHLYAALLELGRVAGWDKARFEQLYEEGARIEPQYQNLHQAKAAYLLPTWHGRAGESEEFAQEVAERIGGAAGQQLYYLIATNALSRVPGEAFNHMRFSLGSAKEGFRSLEQSYGVDTRALNENAALLARNGDLAGADAMFKRIGPNFDAGVWRGKNEFDALRASAAQVNDTSVLGSLFGNYMTLLLGLYGVGLLLSRKFLGAAAGPVASVLTVGVLTGVAVDFNQQDRFMELMNWTRDQIDSLAAIIERSIH